MSICIISACLPRSRRSTSSPSESCVVPGLHSAELLPLTTTDVAAPQQWVLQLFARPALPVSTHSPGRDCKALPKTWEETTLLL